MMTTTATGYVEPPMIVRKIAIVGFADETRGLAPYEDPSCEIWILNMLHAHVPRWDRLWEMHDRVTLEVETAELKMNMDHLGYLQSEQTRPIYMIDAQPDIPCSVRFPIERVKEPVAALCEKLANTPYFTSTFAYMIAYAVELIVARRTNIFVPEPGEEIYVCGVEMLNGEEYAYQRSCAEFFAGYAIGKGIKLHIPDRSALLESDGMYGYAPPATLELLGRMRLYYQERRKKELALRDDAATRRDKAKADWNTHDGAAQALDWIGSHLTYLSRGGKV